MTIQNWLKLSIQALTLSNIPSAQLDARLILESILGKSPEWLIAHNEDELGEKVLTRLNNKIIERQSHIPLAYIIGSKQFYGRNFIVTPAVLIPRPESEAIIELLKATMDERQNLNTVYDIGTGSGCLAITVKLEFPQLHVSASDISKSALSVARKNARELEADIRFFHSDLLENLPELSQTRNYGVIANLPYVPTGLVTSEEITKEPSAALFSGQDGLDHYKKFWSQILAFKNKPALILAECLLTQQAEMDDLAKQSGYCCVKRSTLIQLYIPCSETG